MNLEKKLLKKKLQEFNNLHSDQFKISKEIKDFISNEITTSIRELVGAINRISIIFKNL